MPSSEIAQVRVCLKLDRRCQAIPHVLGLLPDSRTPVQLQKCRAQLCCSLTRHGAAEDAKDVSNKWPHVDCFVHAGYAGCDACQCSLAKAITPSLVQSGKILSSEAYMPSSLNTIADTLTQCKKEFAVQILENTNTTLSQLSSFDSCSTDVKVVSQCISAKPDAPAAAPQAVATDGSSMAQEVMGEACAASVSGTSNATGCPSQAAAQVMAGAPLMSGGGLVIAPVSDASVLSITPSNTRGSITWRALCWCEETYDPVCDAATRKQYPNACSAQCQVGV